MQEDDEHSLSESHLSEDAGEHVRRKVSHGGEDDNVSKSSNKSMSVFMSSLVGLHSGDWSFCLQVDNAKPRDLPPPLSLSSVEPGSDSASAVSNTRKSNGLSRWESTPTSNQKGHKATKSGPTTAVTQATRPRAMRPWRHPSNNLSSSTSFSSNTSSSTRKLDTPISRPQRHDSNRSLQSNAKLPQRLESNRSLKPELSIRDIRELTKPSPDDGHNSQAPHLPSRHDISMDLRVLLECEEDNVDDAAANFGDGGDGTGCVFLKIPAMQSQHSLWGSASTMTASFRTMASTRSLMSHYSISHSSSNYNASSSLDLSKRSLFCKSDDERPLCPPLRTKSREGVHMGFRATACELPVRRPVRHPSDRSMLNGSGAPEAATAPVEAAVTTSDCPSLLPALNRHDSSFTFSFKLIRSLSEQTLETAVLFQSRQVDANNNSNANPKDAFGRFLKRTLSDSLLLMSQDLNFSEHGKK
jgi:hypothetical protein